MNRQLLAIYLNDHLAGATAGRELARRARGHNREGELGVFLARLADEIEEDRQSLIAIMGTLDVSGDRLKQLAGWAGEKVGRLKLNGRVWSYSPLSRLTELEALSLGVFGKRSLWLNLQHLAPEEPRLARAGLEALLKRADAQLKALEKHRVAATSDLG